MAASLGARSLRAVVRKRVQSSAKLYNACRELVLHGDIGNAIPALTELARQSPYGRDARELLAVCKHLRRTRLLEETVSVASLLEDLRGVDRKALDETQPHSVLMRRVEGAEETLVVFVSSAAVPLLTVSLLHHCIRSYPVNILYVRTAAGLFHMAGLNGLGADYPASLESLGCLIDRLGGRRTYCIGGSSGGYAALRFALDLRASGVMSFSGPTTIDPGQLGPDGRYWIDRLIRAAPQMAIDLAPLYRSADVRPRVVLCYGTSHPGDFRHAKRLAEIDGVRLYAIEGYAEHDTLAYFIINQKFDLMFDLLRSDSA
jgi:hypothetical protein